jgi:cytochrome c
MKSSKILVVLAAVLLIVALSGVALGQEKATPQEVVAKVKEAATILSQTGDLTQFKQRQGPWVWKDTYIFVEDCDKKVNAAHPIKPDQMGQDLASIKDPSGRKVFPDPEAFCAAARKPSGVWTEYLWPKAGATESSRKVSYHLSAKGTPYVVSAGIYDDNATVDELSKLTSGK